MEAIATALIFFTIIGTMLKMSFLSTKTALAEIAAMTLFTGLMWPVAIEQSMTRISAWLADSSLMLDIAVVLSVEVILQMAYCLLSVNAETGENFGKFKRAAFAVLKYVPGLLIFPVLFSILVYAVFSFPGTDFGAIAFYVASAVFLVMAAGRIAARLIIPEPEIRTELLFIIYCIVAFLGIVTTVNGQTSAAGTSSVDMGSLIGVTAIVLLTGAAGFFLYRLRLRLKYRAKAIAGNRPDSPGNVL